MKSIMTKRKEEEQEAFLGLSPLERIRTMHNLLLQIISLKARSEGVSEYEIYRRYLKNRDKKLAQLLSPPADSVHEPPGEFL